MNTIRNHTAKVLVGHKYIIFTGIRTLFVQHDRTWYANDEVDTAFDASWEYPLIITAKACGYTSSYSAQHVMPILDIPAYVFGFGLFIIIGLIVMFVINIYGLCKNKEPTITETVI